MFELKRAHQLFFFFPVFIYVVHDCFLRWSTRAPLVFPVMYTQEIKMSNARASQTIAQIFGPNI